MNNEEQKMISGRFCAADSDVTFESCDNVLFKVHRPNLVTHSEGFAPPSGTNVSSDSEPAVLLPESADVLELLFQYMYPQRTPDLEKAEFSVFANLAETAEKYQVFGAMDICNTRMEALIPKYPFQVLDYAVRHGYLDLVTKVEDKYTFPLAAKVFQLLSPTVYIAWSRYYISWLDVCQNAYRVQYTPISENHKASKYQCKGWMYCFSEVSRCLGGCPSSLLDLKRTFQSDTECTTCQKNLDVWRAHVKGNVDRLPKFSTFL